MKMISAAEAVEALIHEYYKLVFHTIYGLTHNWEESQDLTQDTFHQALKSIDAARAASGPQFHAKAWLLRIALNTVRMQHRRSKIMRFIPFSSLHERKQHEQSEANIETLNEQAAPVQPGGYGANNLADPAEALAEQDVVRRTIQKLPESLRVCLLLSIVGGLSNGEIAHVLDLKEEAVRQRLTRARKQFKQAYSYESGEEVIDTEPVTLPLRRRDSQTTQTAKEHGDQHVLINKPQRLSLAADVPLMWRNYV